MINTKIMERRTAKGFTGTVDAIRANAEVKLAYLGEEEVA